MGACMSSGGGDTIEARTNRDLEKMIKEDERKMRQHVKLLLLGAGASGKSTVLKQMRLIHNVSFTPAELEYYRQLVFSNVVNGMKLIIDAMDEWEMSVESHNRKYIALVDNPPDIKDGETFPMQYREPLESLWKDRGVQEAFARGNESALPENLPYFFADLDRFWRPDFMPDQQDILRVRVKTTGISETKFVVGELTYSMFDVGGQRSERRKWVSCFENVTAILFLVALSGYDECLVEDKDSNQMQEALMLFDSICNSQWFTKTSIILFLNKDDIFRQKIMNPKSQIAQYFPNFDGQPLDYEGGREFFRKQFTRLNRSSTKEVYTHCTTATDTAMLKVVMAAVQDTILRSQLRDMAMI
ncbi:hypothetical protein FFLO_03018 [Filobasidium floriforme]|uniref:Guanine nucleotide-binding protein alpha-2 subunit n=1 Tax=Filobasidium floriforme TaxID=5210 RepID=A0A8K0JLJ4_9TREE|nr:putative heterotrimeric G-protein GTPase [Filobasidium floriforme]KAG7553586.1 hypothetical protein FFLO_03018 [Filobasidium floriforme]KAH8082764.1 putative heterotrimeric G-protein GTPase [Filobasidium floriforme]